MMYKNRVGYTQKDKYEEKLMIFDFMIFMCKIVFTIRISSVDEHAVKEEL